MLEGMAAKSSPQPGLRGGPFTVADARRVGLRWDDLQTRIWARLSRGQYAWMGLPQDAVLKLEAVAQRLPASYAFSGSTAAWFLGLDVAWSDPIEATIGREVPVRARAGVRLRRAELPESDVIVRQGFRTTSAMRTVCDLASRRVPVESVVAVDIAVRAGRSSCPTSRVMLKVTPVQNESKGCGALSGWQICDPRNWWRR